MTLNEEFRPINGFPDYMIGNCGTVYRISTHKVVPQQKTTGYYGVNLRDPDGNHTRRLTHRLVADAFLPRVKGKDYVDHIDGTRDNNRVDNLRWCTFQENCSFPIAKERQIQAALCDRGRPVIQCDKNGNELARFRGLNEAERETGIRNISHVCRGKRKSAGGYYWKYEIV